MAQSIVMPSFGMYTSEGKLVTWLKPSGSRVEAGQIFVPMIPAIVGGALWVIFVAYLFGRKERTRIGVIDPRRRS